jgi:hypothetical protein
VVFLEMVMSSALESWWRQQRIASQDFLQWESLLTAEMNVSGTEEYHLSMVVLPINE